MNLIQLVQVMVFDLIDVSFCIFLALIPFRDYLCSPKKMFLLVSVLYVLVVASRILSLTGLLSINTISVMRLILYVLIHQMAVHSTRAKRLFVLCVMLNYASFIMILFHFFAVSISPGQYDLNLYSNRFSLLLFCVFLLGLPVIYWLMDKKIRSLINSEENVKVWNYIWLAPATFCLIFHYSVLENGGISVFVSQWYNVVFSIVTNAGSILVTYLIIRLVGESNDNLELKAVNYQLVMQSLQYENLKSRMEETQIARHDLHHHIRLVKSYLDEGRHEELDHYIGQYVSLLTLDSPITYCENHALNAVLAFYGRIAKERGYEFKVDAGSLQLSSVSDVDATVLLGNLLENAMEACARQTEGDRYIHIWLKQEKTAIILAVDNTYDGIIKECNGGFTSSKNGFTGTGVVSIKKIAGKYHGVARFQYQDGVFCASVMLNP